MKPIAVQWEKRPFLFASISACTLSDGPKAWVFSQTMSLDRAGWMSESVAVLTERTWLRCRRGGESGSSTPEAGPQRTQRRTR